MILGIGPGSSIHMTSAVIEALKKSQVIVGYHKYIKLIKEFTNGKEVYTTGMTGEIERCKKAISLACQGKIVSVVSSGDAGIYGMAGLIYELVQKCADTQDGKNIFKKIDIEIFPGVSSVNASASCLGAPLMNDFAVISLSDLLVDWRHIEKRIHAAAVSDFVIVITNPKSKTRTHNIVKAQKILLKEKSPATPVGVVRNAKRANESVTLTTLEKLLEAEIDMSTSIIVGNSQTITINEMMVTPRGYPIRD